MRRDFVISSNEENITELLLLKVILHLAEGLLRMICSMEVFVRPIAVHSHWRRAAVYRQPGREEMKSLAWSWVNWVTKVSDKSV